MTLAVRFAFTLPDGPCVTRTEAPMVAHRWSTVKRQAISQTSGDGQLYRRPNGWRESLIEGDLEST